MEFSEQHEYTPKPEFDPMQPALLFKYIKQKQQWIKHNVNIHHQTEVIDHLIEEVERFSTEYFPEAPELAISSDDVYHTPNLNELDQSITLSVIEARPLPLEGDDADLYGEHTIKGRLFGFHKGKDNDVRVYVDTNEGVRQLMGGIYTPLLSVGVENARIKFAEYETSERLEELEAFIQNELLNYQEQTIQNVKEVYEQLNANNLVLTKKLHEGAAKIAEIARSPDVSVQFIDALLEVIKLKLRLDIPHDIIVSFYRELISHRGYTPRKGPEQFDGIVPKLALIGETNNKWLAFVIERGDVWVQVPVINITSMYKTDR